MASRPTLRRIKIAAMQSSRVIAGVLAASVSMPSLMIGHLFKQGNHGLALKLVPVVLVMVLIAAAIMQLRDTD